MFSPFRALTADRPAPPAPALYLARREFQREGRWEAVTGIYAAWDRPGQAIWPADLAPEELAQRLAPQLRRPPDLRQKEDGIDHWLWRVDDPAACAGLLAGLTEARRRPDADAAATGLAFIVARRDLRLSFQPHGCVGQGRAPRPAGWEVIACHELRAGEAGQRQLVELEEDLRFEGLTDPVGARLEGPAVELCRLPIRAGQPPWEALEGARGADVRPLPGSLREAAAAVAAGANPWALCLPPLTPSRMFMLLGPDGPWGNLPGAWHPGAPGNLIAIGRD